MRVLILLIFLSGCIPLGLQVGTPGHYGLNDDGGCSEECEKVKDYCDCTEDLLKKGLDMIIWDNDNPIQFDSMINQVIYG